MKLKSRRDLDLRLLERLDRRRGSPTSAVSFCSPMKSFRSGGITRRTACGRTTERERLAAREPERARRRLLARMHRLDPGAVDLGDVRRVDEDERDDPPEDRRGRDALDRERRRAEAEQRDHEDRRHAAEEVGVGDRERADREEDRARAGCAGRRAASAETRMNTSAIRKIFTFSRNARAMSGNDSRYSSQSKNAALTSGQLGACVTP